MKDTNPHPQELKYRSPLRSIDRRLLRQLCEFHPWSLRELGLQVGMAQSTLSNVLAGQRPLPTRVAEQFLSVVGMRADGSLDANHGFVFVERVGREVDLDGLLKRMFPEAPGALHLSRPAAPIGAEAGAQSAAFGRALFDGRFAAVIHEPNTQKDPTSVGNLRLHDTRDEHGLLSLNPLPSKLQILKAFAGGQFARVVTWEEVKLLAESRGLTALDVVNLIDSASGKKLGR